MGAALAPLTQTHIMLLETGEQAGLGSLDNCAIVEVYDMLKKEAEAAKS